MGRRKIPKLRMVLFWTFFVAANLTYYSFVRELQDPAQFPWRRELPTDYIDDRSCSQLSYIWNFGAPRGCEVSDESRTRTGWEHRRVPKNHSEAPTAILLHDVYTTGGSFTRGKLFYLCYLCFCGFYVVYKYVYPLFGMKWS